MSKILSILLGSVAVGLAVVLVLSFSASSKRIAELAAQVAERDARIASLDAAWQELGEASTALVLNRNVTSGEEINEVTAPELFQIVTVPKKLNLNLLTTADFPGWQFNAPTAAIGGGDPFGGAAGDPFGEAPLEGEAPAEAAPPVDVAPPAEQPPVIKTGLPGAKFIRASLSEGAVVAKDYLLERQLRATERKYDMLVDTPFIGMLPGAYVDVRIKFPFGQDYIALSHKRIDELNGGVLKVTLTEYEIEVYNSMLIDKLIYDAEIYLLEYVDSGAQSEAVLNYPLNPDVQAFMSQNPAAINDVREVMAAERELAVAKASGIPEDLQQKQQYFDQLSSRISSYNTSTRGNTIFQQQQQFLQRMDLEEMGGNGGGNFDLGDTKAPGGY